LLGEKLIAFRDSQGRLGLLDRQCPHRRSDLFFGRNEECGLRCSYHGWKFDVDGNVVEMPAEPENTPLLREIKIKSYPVREQGGVIWAYLGDRAHMPADPPFLEWARVADSLGRSLDPKQVRLPPGRRGWRVVVRVDAVIRLADGRDVRPLRALQLLELVNSDDAKKLLEKIAAATPETFLNREARRAALAAEQGAPS